MSDWRTAVLFVLAVGAAMGVTRAPARAAEASDEQLMLLEAALPEAPVVAPARPRRVLIFTLCKGYFHGVIPFASEALQRLGEKTGAYEAVVSDDVEMFRGEKLAAFDAIIFNNTTGTLFEEPQLKQNLLEFVRGGKGIVGVHAATDCFYDWAEYGELMGGYFHGHPWHEPVTLRIEEPEHPICAPFGGTSFVVKDEIYQFKAPYSRDMLRVLVRLDTSGTDTVKSGIKRADGDFAVSWVRSYGEGRVFYCSLGHRHGIFYNPVVLRHYLAGIQFALGDLEADTTPSAAWSRQTGAPTVLDDAFREAAEYEPGESRFALRVIEEAVRDALDDAEARRGMQDRLTDLLQSADATVGGKAFACRQLAVVGDAGAVPALAELLADEALSHMARYALERIPGKAAGDALRDAVGELAGKLRIGVVNSLAARAEPETAEFLMTLDLGEDEPDVATVGALMAALLASADDERLHWLADATGTDEIVNDPERGAVMVGPLLRYAEHLVEAGRTETAEHMYRGLYETAEEDHVRAAGLVGWAHAAPDKCVGTLMMHLASGDSFWQGTAGRLLAEVPGDGVTSVVAERLDAQSAQVQVALLGVLARRGGAAANAAALKAAASEDPAVRDAAIDALGDLGEPSSVNILASLAAEGRDAARASLNRLDGPDVDGAIAGLMLQGPTKVRNVLARSLGERQATAHVQALIRVAALDTQESVRLTAIESLGALAGEAHLASLTGLLLEAPTEAQREALRSSLIGACLRCDDRAERARPIVEALPHVEPSMRVMLLEMLGKLGGETALEAVRSALGSGDAAVSASGLSALANWPDAAAAGDLLAIVQESSDSRDRLLALRGYVRAAGLARDREPAERMAMYEKAMALARDEVETRLVLGGLAEHGAAGTLHLAAEYLDDEGLRGDAAEAVLSVAERLGEDGIDEARSAVDMVLATCGGDESLRARAGEVIDRIEKDLDYITTWKFAGPFTQDDLGAEKLFDVAFAPEPEGEDAEAAAWREVPEDAVDEPGIVDLNAMESGSHCCGYVMTEIISDRPQEARLELGSDDGLKVWFNGAVVHEANEMRGLTVGEDQCAVDLGEGVNMLLLKVTQGGGGWQVCCRIRGTDGFGLEGVEIRAPQ